MHIIVIKILLAILPHITCTKPCCEKIVRVIGFGCLYKETSPRIVCKKTHPRTKGTLVIAQKCKQLPLQKIL